MEGACLGLGIFFAMASPVSADDLTGQASAHPTNAFSVNSAWAPFFGHLNLEYMVKHSWFFWNK
jgi:hypothetical protein